MESGSGEVDIVERSMAAWNLAVLCMFPDYGSLNLPRGNKRVRRFLTKLAAKRLMHTEEILFDPDEMEFFHKDTSEQTVTVDQIMVVASSLELIATIGFDELVSLESQLYEN